MSHDPSFAEALAARLRDGAPANIALMHLLIAAPSPAAVTAALEGARAAHPAVAARIAEVATLSLAHPGAWAAVHAAADGVDHASSFSTAEAALDAQRMGFDHLAGAAPEAGVALYALGDPVLLAAATDEVMRALRGWGLIGPHRDVLDLGCGIGRFADALAPEVRSVLGLDLSAGMIDEARRRVRRGNVRFAQSSGRDLAGVESGAVDLALCADVFPYLVEAGLAADQVAELARVLRYGGTAVILNYSYRGQPERDRADLAAAAVRHGFTLERVGERPFRLWDAAAFTMTRGI